MALDRHGPSCPTILNLVRNKNTTANNVSLRVEGSFGALDSDNVKVEGSLSNSLPVSRGGCSAASTPPDKYLFDFDTLMI